MCSGVNPMTSGGVGGRQGGAEFGCEEIPEGGRGDRNIGGGVWLGRDTGGG